jgi:hypothetical protein
VNEWKYQMRRKKRGEFCLINMGTYGKLCGCGHRTDPPKREKTRIVKRALRRQLSKDLAAREDT